MDDLYLMVGKRIRTLRKEKGMTREQLAELASISPKFLYEVENGKKGFSAVNLYNISKALEVKCDYIMSGEVEAALEMKVREILKILEDNQQQ